MTKNGGDHLGSGLYRELGLDQDADQGEVDAAYLRLRSVETAKVRRAWAVLGDRHYRAVYDVYGEHALASAGWFDDGLLPENADAAWSLLATPMSHLNLAETAGERAVLVTTGAFNPLHDGHLDMMERARQRLEMTGIAVVGGWISPDHDDYVRQKDPGSPHALDRVRMCELQLANIDWLAVDRGQVHGASKVNFTHVVRRIEALLAARSVADIQVWYVFGGDNAGFDLAFVGSGRGVCVTRAGYEAPQSLAHTVQAEGSRRVSSSEIRAKPTESLPSPVGTYVVRDDLRWAAPHAEPQRLTKFREQVLASLSHAMPLSQVRTWSEMPESIPGASISLDSWWAGDHQLGVTREFHALGKQVKPIRLTARPGWRDIAGQLAVIPPGEYVLVDDDIASGATERAVRELLGHSGITVSRTLTLVEQLGFVDVCDVVDLRDFLLGSVNGGLTCRYRAGPGRLPYLAPYVDLTMRSVVPADQIAAVNVALWTANAEFYADDEPLQAVVQPDTLLVLTELGFDPDMGTAEFCAWHAERVGRLR